MCKIGGSLQLKEFLSDLQNDRPIYGLESILRRTIAYLSCRTAVKAGDFLTQEERKELLKKLHKTKNLPPVLTADPQRFECICRSWKFYSER